MADQDAILEGLRRGLITEDQARQMLGGPQAAPQNPISNAALPAYSVNRTLTGMADAIGNAPTNVANLGIAAYGAARKALGGKAEDMPATLPTPDYAAKGAQALGLDVGPHDLTKGQQYADMAISGGTGALMGGEPSLLNAATGAMAGVTGQAVGDATGSPTAGLLASMATVPAVGSAARGTAASLAARDARQAQLAAAQQTPEALARAQAYRNLGIEPTKAQLSQDPTAFQQELQLRTKAGGYPLAQQYNTAVKALGAKLEGLPTTQPLNNPAAGERVMNTLQGANDRGQSLADRAYAQMRQSVPQGLPVNTANIANEYFNRLQNGNTQLYHLPKPIVSAINQMSKGQTGQATMSNLQGFSEDINSILYGSRELTSAERGALSQVKDMVDAEAGRAAQAAGSDVFKRWQAARQYTAQMHAMQESVPALHAVKSGRSSPDQFISRYVTNAPVADVTALRDFLGKTDPAAWQQIKAQIAADIQTSATKGDSQKFLQSGFNKEIESLRQTGKLDVIFDPHEVSQLQDMQTVSRAIEGPQGVSRTGLGGAGYLSDTGHRAMDAVLSHIAGPVAKFASPLFSMGSNARQARAALNVSPRANALGNALSGPPPSTSLVNMPLLQALMQRQPQS